MSNNNKIWAAQQTDIFGWMESGSGNAAVVARAGTGKTTVIEHGIINAPETKSVYCVFNKKNQLEAERRIKKTGLDIKTLHSLGYAFVRNSWSGIRPDDSRRGEDIEMERIMEISPRLPSSAAYAVKRTVGFAKNTILGVPSTSQLVELMIDKGFEPEFNSEEDQAAWTVETLAGIAKQAMEASLNRNKQGRISFDDMVWLPTAANMVRPWYQLVIVDEAQDMSMPQLEMAIRACKSSGRIMIVGDPRQCIYGFRGAAINGMQLMIERLQAKVFPLTTTYRCAKSIVALAATLVPDYQAAPTADEGQVLSAPDMAEVLKSIKIGDAILSRKNAPLMPACLSLIRAGVPARIEGRDIGRELANIAKKLNAKTVPNFLTKLTAWGEKMAKRAMAGKASEDRLSQISDQVETLKAVAEGATSVADIITKVTNLFVDSDSKEAKPAVVLSSIHKAKGLEWTNTFLIKNTFRVTQGPASESEEANIAYVAITRAKKTMTWVGPAMEKKAVAS